MGIIVSSIIGCGTKELLDEYNGKINILDVSSSNINKDSIGELDKMVDDSDILIVNCNSETLTTLIDNNINFDVFYPSPTRRMEFMENAVREGKSFSEIRDLDLEFSKVIDNIDSLNGSAIHKHKLANKNQYVWNNPMILEYINKILDEKKTKD